MPSLSHRDADKHKPVGQPKEGGGHFPPLREEVESRQSTNDSRSTKRETKCKSNIHPMPPIHRHTREAQSYTLSESEPSNALGVREAIHVDVAAAAKAMQGSGLAGHTCLHYLIGALAPNGVAQSSCPCPDVAGHEVVRKGCHNLSAWNPKLLRKELVPCLRGAGVRELGFQGK